MIEKSSFEHAGKQNMTEEQKVETSPATRQGGIPAHTIFIGKKPIMAYVTAIVMQFTSGSSEVTNQPSGEQQAQTRQDITASDDDA